MAHKRSIFEEIRASISERQSPTYQLKYEKLCRVLADHEKRIRKLERELGVLPEISEFNPKLEKFSKKRARHKKNKSKKK